MAARRKRRIPQLSFTEARSIGWHVSYRDPATGSPRKHRFGITDRAREADAREAYHHWLAEFLTNGPPKTKAGRPVAGTNSLTQSQELTPMKSVAPGSIGEIASGLLSSLEARVRNDGEPRRQGSINKRVFSDRRKHIRDFLAYLKEHHGEGAASRMLLADLTMADVEGFNRWAAGEGYSASQVNKRMQMVKAIIDRAGRPEYGGQVLSWNWDSRDVVHGKPSAARVLPRQTQLRRVLAACEHRERTMIWMAIGLGFGQQDLADVRVGQIDAKSYDLRRSKTGIERYGTTPPLVWEHIERYLKATPRRRGDLLFVTRRGYALVHGGSNAVTQWWTKLREALGETRESLGGFYTLRHLGATEFGSRRGCSISEMRRWLGHGASSQMADTYMRPVGPEYRKVIEWVRKRLRSKQLLERAK